MGLSESIFAGSSFAPFLKVEINSPGLSPAISDICFRVATLAIVFLRIGFHNLTKEGDKSSNTSSNCG